MMKRYIAILSIISIVAIQLFPVLSVHADTLVVPEDTANYYYVYNHIELDEWTYDDFLTVDNYNDYYNALTGSQKTDVNIKFPNYQEDNGVINALLEPTSNQTNAGTLYFRPIIVDGVQIPFEDCEATIWITQAGSLLACSLFYNPNGDEIVSSANYNYSDTEFYISFVSFSIEAGGYIGDKYYYRFGQYQSVQATSQYDSTNNIYYNYTYDSNYVGPLYDTRTCLFTSNTFADINTPAKAYQEYKNGSSLSIDRRPSRFISKIEGSESSDGTLAVLDGSYHNIMGGASFDDMTMMSVYELNDYAKSRRFNLEICYDYTFSLSGTFNTYPFTFSKSFYDTNGYFDTYDIGNSNYLLIDMDEALSKIKTNPDRSFQNTPVGGDEAVNEAFTFIMGTTDSNQFHKNYGITGFSALECVDLMNNIGLNSVTTYKDKTSSLNINLNANIQSKLNWDVGLNYDYQSRTINGVMNNLEYATLQITIFLRDKDTGDTSTSLIWTYDFKSGTHTQEGGFDEVQYDENNQVIPFNGNYSYGSSATGGYFSNIVPSDYNFNSGSYAPIANGGAGGSSNASVGDIIVYAGTNSVSKVFIDMPMEEALEHTPNLSQLYSDMKSGFLVSTNNSESIIQLTKDTYTFIPTEIWGYITICVVTCCGLAVYRNFRGR